MILHLGTFVLIPVLAALLLDRYFYGVRLADLDALIVIARDWSVLAELWPFIVPPAVIALAFFLALARKAAEGGNAMADARFERRRRRAASRRGRLHERHEAVTEAARRAHQVDAQTTAVEREARQIRERTARAAAAALRHHARAVADLEKRLERCQYLECAIAEVRRDVARLEAAVPRRPAPGRQPRHAASPKS